MTGVENIFYTTGIDSVGIYYFRYLTMEIYFFLSFGAESFVFQVAVQKFKDQDLYLLTYSMVQSPS